MNYPAIPLITVDPYFSLWSCGSFDSRKTNKNNTFHWTGSPNSLRGIVEIDGKPYRFLGLGDEEEIREISLKVTALSTEIVYEGGGIRLKTKYTSPLIANDLYLSSRPVSYLHTSFEALDGKSHTVSVKISVSEELVLNKKGEGKAEAYSTTLTEPLTIKMGNTEQNILNKCGDDVRIDWGYFYLSIKGEGKTFTENYNNMLWVCAKGELKNEKLFLFSYDDIKSLVYFGKNADAFWKKGGLTIEDAIKEASNEYDSLIKRCDDFSYSLKKIAKEKGGGVYSELLSLAYRQVMAGHKLITDEKGDICYISKECFSNGCAATVDVTYPSAPMFLYFNPELLKAMLRPVFRYGESDKWEYDFAPHDVGCYPFVNGQVYADNRLEYQMPLEECGNMIILVDALCRKENDFTFAKEHSKTLEKWCKYLIKFGEDPENQLCTDDFAGHLAHNCNLSIKAIMGIVGYSHILKSTGFYEKGEELLNIAKKYALSFMERAKNKDGSYRLAYDKENTFSLKYNAVWDKVWKTNIFPDEFFEGEILRYKKEALPYGVPLDSREKYTKSDWLLWSGCLCNKKEDFEFFVELLYKAFDTTRDFVPMTDWYYADTAQMRSFRHRTVQGGLFMKLIID